MEQLQLHDIHLPESAGIWPLALGWWILIALVSVIATWIILKTIKRAKQKRQQRKVLAKFKALEKQLKANPANATIAEINTLLRQVAVNYFPRIEIASLTGGDWLHFLDKSGKTKGFTRGAGRILIEAPYQQDKQLGVQSDHHIDNLNLNEFIPLVHRWAKRTIKGNAHD